ncbi:hypothetical protein D9M68_740390 [compost metagenome]
MPGQVGMRTLLPESGQRQVDQPRAAFAQVVIVQAEPAHHAGTVGLDQNVCPTNGLMHRSQIACILQVAENTPLATVERAKQPWREAPGIVAVWRTLDLQHVSAHVDEGLCQERAGQQFGQVNHANARKRPGRRGIVIPVRGCLDGLGHCASPSSITMTASSGSTPSPS